MFAISHKGSKYLNRDLNLAVCFLSLCLTATLYHLLLRIRKIYSDLTRVQSNIEA